MKYFDAKGREVTAFVEGLIAEGKAYKRENEKLVAALEKSKQKRVSDGKSKTE